MSKQSYLIYLIFCAVLPNEILASSDDNNESSSVVRHSHSPNRNLPRQIPRLGDLQDYGLVNLEEPTEVEIITIDNHHSSGLLICQYYVVTRPENVRSPFRIRLSVGGRSMISHESKTFIDYHKNVAVIALTHPISFARPKYNALQEQHYSDASIYYALAIVHDWMQFTHNEIEVIGSRWHLEDDSSVLRRRQQLINQHLPRHIPELNEIGYLGVVDTERPTRVDLIDRRGYSCPGFVIHSFFVVTRPRCLIEYVYVKLTVGHKSVNYEIDAKYIEPTVAVVRVTKPISLSRPEVQAFYYEYYPQAAVDYAVDIVEKWIQKYKYTMRLTGFRRTGGYYYKDEFPVLYGKRSL